MSKEYYVYIMTNKSRTLYTGVTNNLMRRVHEHKNKLVPGFTSKYNIQFLVYYEAGNDINAAIAREKQIKGWLRSKKIALIDSMNPQWKDLSEEWDISTRAVELSSEKGESRGLVILSDSEESLRLSERPFAVAQGDMKK
jgi:putative endonuclease